ncbi:MAG: KEOPS complex kinase/ATPase Bud32 [Candidatus Woesearchaeota archaeon]|jgi:TP53 regulating kinase-like protein|nr:KEOPS complex kinase/ATPase Bud32 [Candidatus Woesearchaeota archaeon]
MKKLISQGAEAKIFLEKSTITKDRFRKTYRIEEIDNKLRKSRTKKEAKILDKLNLISFPAPKLISSDDKQTLEMEYLKGEELKDVLEKGNYIKLSEEIGKKVATLHNNNLIHGDLTTSNMIYQDQIYFIDFGLSFTSYKVEDMAIDLHLLRQALESKHHKIWEKSFNTIIKTYQKESEKGKEVLKRLEVVETRGRYKKRK